MEEDMTKNDNQENVEPQQELSQPEQEDLVSKYSQLYGDESQTSPTEPKYTQEDINKALYGELLALKKELESIKEQRSKETFQTDNQPEGSSFSDKTAWLAKIRDGKFEEATEDLFNSFVKSLDERGFFNKLQTGVTEQSLEAIRAENELSRYVDSIRAKKPHLAPLEDFISSRVQTAMMDANQAGRISSIPEYVNMFKSVLDREIERAEQIYQNIRTSGNPDSAQARQKVASGAVVTPSTVGGPREPSTTKYVPQSVSEYVKARQALNMARRGFNTE